MGHSWFSYADHARPNDQRFGREGRGRPSRDVLIRPRAFVGCKRLFGRIFAGRGAESALIVT
jgi:hypothetical protein